MSVDRNDALKQIFENQNNLDYTTQADSLQIFNLQSNMDTFPYNQWFRGNFASSQPIIAKRMAGFRPQKRYYSNNVSVSDYPKHCFQIPPHTYKPLVCNHPGLPCSGPSCCRPTATINFTTLNFLLF